MILAEKVGEKQVADKVERYKLKAALRTYAQKLHEKGRSIKDVVIIGSLVDGNFNLSKSEMSKKAIARKIQGSTADLVIGNAMAKVDDAIQQFDSNLILQIHDELIIEVPVEAERDVGEIVKKKMEGAVRLNVPLKVNIVTASNWRQKVVS